jgi:thiosulfate dehydrogenase [quinone] large subunit
MIAGHGRNLQRGKGSVQTMPPVRNAPGLSPARQAYVLLRLALGMSLFLHGATRIDAGPDKFALAVVRDFQHTLLPAGLVHAYGLVLPFVEGLIGLLLLLGWLTQGALVLGGLTIVSLIFGTALRAEWNTIGLQLIYALGFYILLSRLEDNGFALDGRHRPRA